MEGDLDKLMEASTIEFPRDLKSKELKKLLKYISNQLPAHISGKLERHINFLSPDDSEKSIDYGSINFVAMIRDTKNFRFDAFETYHNDDSGKISGIRFQTIPGYSLGDHDDKNVELWQDVRKVIESYFQQNSNPHQ